MAHDIRNLIEDNGLYVRRITAADGIFLRFDCAEIQVLLAFCDRPLPTDHFLDARRPDDAAEADPAVLQRLIEHRSSITVLVLDHPDTAPAVGQVHLKRALCWDVTDYLAAATRPALVFWCETDTLFSAAEFRRSDDCAPAGIAPGHVQHRHLRTAPLLPDAALDWVAGCDPDQGPARAAPARPRARLREIATHGVETLMSIVLPTRLAVQIDRCQAWLTPQRAMHAATLACTATTAGLSSLVNLGWPI
ncbi:MAG: hypothetical protein QNJ16_19480 [Rhodobacter sp.]|nr:hypothetical protein [Rhodobacter sp.]